MINTLENIRHSKSGNFFLIAGPCVVENEDITYTTAERIVEICDKLEIPLIFKSSFKKANRSKVDSFTGIGDAEALKVLDRVREIYEVPVITDIHSPEDALVSSQYVDALQIPAFLARQTDLLIAAAKTGLMVNIKKGQFMSPESMLFAMQKVIDCGNKRVMLTDRGTQFGYQDLIVDFRGIPTMKSFGCPVIMDCTHSLQQPNQSSGVSGGRPDMIETIARAAIAVGADGLFIETHPNPSIAKSDGANMLHLDLLEGLLSRLVKIRQTVNGL